MQLIVLRPGRSCARWSAGSVVLVALLLLVLVSTAVVVAFLLGKDQREVIRVPLHMGLDADRIDAAEGEAAWAGMEYLTGRMMQLERQLARLEGGIRSITDALDLDKGALASLAGDPREPLLENYASPLEVDARLHALESRLLRHLQSVTRVEAAVRRQSSRETQQPHLRPVGGDAWMSSAFGYRDDPFTGERRLHSGVDFAGRADSTVHAAGGGLVTHAAPRSSYGQLVEILHGGGTLTRYAHNSELLVHPGQRVEAGEPIARMGQSGRATDTHLHYEVVQTGRRVDPARFLPAPQ
ncbi:MAG: M23 family metallopeptidase [Thioalkalivibrio sp.]|nr:M23 family metallopeptidase [Thioalkalivibrio sp.]